MIPKDQYLLKQAFQHFNEMVRQQTLEDIEQGNGRDSKADHHELNKMKAQNKLLLSLRAIQTHIRAEEEPEDES